MMMSIIDACRDPRVFQPAFRNRDTWQSWFAFLSALRQHALVLVALCVGAMVLARAIDDQALGDEFRNAAIRHAVATTGWGDGRGD